MVYMQRSNQTGKSESTCGRIKCAILFSPMSETENTEQSFGSRKSGFLQISPSRKGPWTSVRLNYASRAACWRLGNDVVASEVSVNDGNRYVTIRSLVSVYNNTDFILDLCLNPKASNESMRQLNDTMKSRGIQIEGNGPETDEAFETEKYNPSTGWVPCLVQPKQDQSSSEGFHQVSN